MAAVKSTCTGVDRSVSWVDGKVFLIDQQALPGEFKVISAATLDGEGTVTTTSVPIALPPPRYCVPCRASRRAQPSSPLSRT